MHGAQRINRPEVQITPVNKGPDDTFQLTDIAFFSGHGSGFDPGITFPFTPLYQEIFFHHAEARDQRAGLTIRAQCHIDAEAVAVCRDLRNSADQPAAKAGEKFVIGNRLLATLRCPCIAVFGVAENQIDVR